MQNRLGGIKFVLKIDLIRPKLVQNLLKSIKNEFNYHLYTENLFKFYSKSTQIGSNPPEIDLEST